MTGIARTPPFRSFQKTAGLTTFDVNTIAVGLELIALGGQKPESMNISWSAPKEPRAAIDKTKHFVLLAMLAHVVDGIDTMLREYSELVWLDLPDSLQATLRKSVTKPGRIEWSISERIRVLLDYVNHPLPVAIAFSELMVNWRNALVHTFKAKFRLSEASESLLFENGREIAAKYAGIDIERTIASFHNRSWPTLKETTTMIAVSQNLARDIDGALLRRSTASESQIERIARYEIAVGMSTMPLGWRRMWGRDLAARERALTDLLRHAGISERKEIISAELTSQFLNNLASSDAEMIEQFISANCSWPSAI